MQKRRVYVMGKMESCTSTIKGFFSSSNRYDKYDEKSCNFWGKILIILVIILSVWNLILQVQTSRHSKQIRHLEAAHETLKQIIKEPSGEVSHFHRRIRRETDRLLENDDTVDNNQENNIGNSLAFGEFHEQFPVEGVLSSPREKRMAKRNKNLQSSGRMPRNKRTDKKTKKDKKDKKEKEATPAHAAHFAAYVDEEKMNRELAEGKESDIGKRSPGGGLVPNEQIYRFWKPAEWSSKSVFNYNGTSGKVTVQRQGLYLLYGQVVFHGPSARKSYGIHINDEVMPFVESLAFDNIHSRNKRNAPFDPSIFLGNYTEPETHKHRHKRETYSSYSQCNTLAVTQLKKGDQVFLRAMEKDRPIITQSYLTFWGIARL